MEATGYDSDYNDNDAPPHNNANDSDSEERVPWQGAVILQASQEPSDAEIFEKHNQDRAEAIASIPPYDKSVEIALDLLGIYKPIWAVVPGTPHARYWADFPGRARRMLRVVEGVMAMLPTTAPT